MTERAVPNRQFLYWTANLAVVVLGAMVLVACSTRGAPSALALPGASSLPTPLATTVQTPAGTWATVPMGNLDQPLNTFWQLFFRPTGAASWTNQVEATATATNGGLVLAPAQGGSVIVGIRPSLRLTYSPLITTSDAGRSWSNGLVTDGLVARPNALAAGAFGQALALVDNRDGSEVLTSAGDLSKWRPVVSQSALAAARGPGQSCGLGSLTAVGYLAGQALVGGSCSRPGVVALFTQSGGTWRLVGPALPRSLERGRAEVLALGAAPGSTSALLSVTSDNDTSLVAAWSGVRGRWTTSSTLPLRPDDQVASFGPADGDGLFVLLKAPSGADALIRVGRLSQRLAGVALPASGDDHRRLRRRGVCRRSGRRRYSCYSLVPQPGVEQLGQEPGHPRCDPVRLLGVIPRDRRPRPLRSRKKRAIVSCDEAREAISARLDGERPPFPAHSLDAHLSTCQACREFEAAALALGRSVRLRATRPVPDDLVETLVALIGPSPRPVLISLVRRRSGAGFGYASTARWAGAIVPAALAAAAISLGVGSHPHLVPTRPPSPCTIGLVARHLPRVG